MKLLAASGVASLAGLGEKLKDKGVEIWPNGNEVDGCAKEDGIDVNAKGDDADCPICEKVGAANVNPIEDGADCLTSSNLEGEDVSWKGNNVFCVKVNGKDADVKEDGTNVCIKEDGVDVNTKVNNPAVKQGIV